MQEDFVAAVAARGAGFDAAESRDDGRVMQVSITRENDGFSGVFRVRSREGESKPREVHAINCNEVVDALAVVTAIALRPNSSDATSAPSQDKPAPKIDAPAQEPPAKPADKRFRGSSRWGWESLPVSSGTLRFDPELAFSINAGASFGQFPSLVLPRLDVSFHLANFVTTPEGNQRITGPIIRGHLSLLGGATLQSGDTRTLVTGQSVGFGICGSPHYDSSGLVLLGCLELGGRRRLSDIEPGCEHPFLYGVALRIASNELRRLKSAVPSVELELVPQIADERPSPEEQLEQRQARALLDDVLIRMPLELRTVFVLFEMEGVEIRQIADLEEIPLGAASSRLRRAREEFSAITKRVRARLLAQGGHR